MLKLKHVVVAISGGVDSAVTAYLLKKQGYRVTGCFMTNWNRQDETLSDCKSDMDKEDAKYVCDKLGIRLVCVDFSKSYWNQVFTRFLHEYEQGMTPNPDILCNKYIKFPMFIKYCFNYIHDVDYVATGHYARLKYDEHIDNYRLYKSVDELKDQTFFLSQIDPNLLKYTLFPIGDYHKNDVRRIAKEIGLRHIHDKRSSVGICFIGKRDFSKFIDDYLVQQPGTIVDLETNSKIGEHTGIHHYTLGQRIPVVVKGSTPGKQYFIAKKDTSTQTIYAVLGTNHPALYHNEMIVERPHWIGELRETDRNTHDSPLTLLDNKFEFKFQTRHRQTPIEHLKREYDEKTRSFKYYLKAKHFFRGIAPGQFAVIYNKEECIGSAKILGLSKSLYDMDYKGQIMNTDQVFLKDYLSN